VVEQNQQVKGIFHWTDIGVTSWYDFALAIQSEALAIGILPKSIPISPVRTEQYPASAARPINSLLDCSKTWKLFSTSPQHWLASLSKCLRDPLNC